MSNTFDEFYGFNLEKCFNITIESLPINIDINNEKRAKYLNTFKDDKFSIRYLSTTIEQAKIDILELRRIFDIFYNRKQSLSLKDVTFNGCQIINFRIVEQNKKVYIYIDFIYDSYKTDFNVSTIDSDYLEYYNLYLK